MRFSHTSVSWQSLAWPSVSVSRNRVHAIHQFHHSSAKIKNQCKYFRCFGILGNAMLSYDSDGDCSESPTPFSCIPEFRCAESRPRLTQCGAQVRIRLGTKLQMPGMVYPKCIRFSAAPKTTESIRPTGSLAGYHSGSVCGSVSCLRTFGNSH